MTLLKGSFQNISDKLNGKERARLLLKNHHQRETTKGTGFLSEHEAATLRNMPDQFTLDTANEVRHLYKQAGLI